MNGCNGGLPARCLLLLMASSRRTQLLWSPHDSDVFAVSSSEHLKLYRFAEEELSGQRSMHVISGVADVQAGKCVAWCPDATQQWTLAIGTGSGRIVLHDCTPASLSSAVDRPTSALCEFVPRTQRVCFSAAWNPLQTTQVAAGLDKVRSDYGVLVWDMSRAHRPRSPSTSTGAADTTAASAAHVVEGSTVRGAGGLARHGADFSSCVSFDLSAVGAVPSVEEPLAQLGNSEAATSIGWLPHQPSCLLVGTGFRWLRMYDLRAREASAGSPVLSCHAHAKGVYGVSFDPFHEMRLVTHSDEVDGVIKGWDIRSMRDNSPLFTVAAAGRTDAGGGRAGAPARGMTHVSWCPTRRGVLSTIVDGSATLHLWEIDQALTRHVEAPTATDDSAAAAGAAGATPPASLGRRPPAVATTASGGVAAAGGAAGARITTYDAAYECDGVVSAVTWHPTEHSRMLLLLRTGADVTLRDLSLLQAPPVAWSVTGPLVHSTRQQQLHVTFGGPTPHRADGGDAINETDGDAPGEAGLDLSDGGASDEHGGHAVDILSCMLRRVHRGYACDPEINLALLTHPLHQWAAPSARDQAQLTTAWRWVVLASTPPEAAMTPGGDAAGGAAAAVHGALEGGAVGVLRLPDRHDRRGGGGGGSGVGGGGGKGSSSSAAEVSESASGLRVYHSVGRLRVMTFFGWEPYQAPSELEAAITRLEATGEYERAALMALYQSGSHSYYNELGRAVRCLERGGAASAAATPERASSLRMMAMVLAGYQPRAPLWWATVHATAASLASPHLRLLLAVLCSPSVQPPSRGGLRLSDSDDSFAYGSNSPSRPSTPTKADADEPLESPLAEHSAGVVLREEVGGASPPAAVEAPGAMRVRTPRSRKGGKTSKTSSPSQLRVSHTRAADGSERRASGEPDGAPAPGATAPGATAPGADGAQPGGLAAGHGNSSVMLEHVVLETAEGDSTAELFSDALCMACRFLQDVPLGTLLRKLVARATASGAINALCLTGLGVAAVPLLQSYIDRTSDVQSVALLASRGPPALLQHPRVQAWLAIYSNVLNSWQLYHARCALDIAVAARIRHGIPTLPPVAQSAPCLPSTASSAAAQPVASRSADRPPNSVTLATPASPLAFAEPVGQVFARCTFCSHSLVTNGGGKPRQQPAMPSTPSGVGGLGHRQPRAHKATACPRCKKPLPRCSICQQHMGCPDPAEAAAALGPAAPRPPATASNAGAHTGAEERPHWETVSSGFGHWMMWCQTCRHGGHAEHLLEWFSQHHECPVSGCSCRCADLDRALAANRPKDRM